MFKWLGKQLIYGRIYLWLKDRLSGLLLSLILLILVFYIHSEYLNYVEFRSKNLEGSYIGLSFIIKNILILAIVLGYMYFYKTINQAKKSIQDTKEIIKSENKSNDKERATSLEEFLTDEEIDR
jgi:H+/Cl- antiporter ClcA